MKHNVQMRLMGRELVLVILGYKPKNWNEIFFENIVVLSHFISGSICDIRVVQKTFF